VRGETNSVRNRRTVIWINVTFHIGVGTYSGIEKTRSAYRINVKKLLKNTGRDNNITMRYNEICYERGIRM
jgi:hypothetical protein